MTNEELIKLFDSLPERDRRALMKIMQAMVEWKISLSRALANVAAARQMIGRDVSYVTEDEDFEMAVDYWIRLGRQYG